MTLTVSLSYTQKAQEAIYDNRLLHNNLGRVSTNIWELHSATVTAEVMAEEVEYALDTAGIPDDEYEITF